MSDTQGTAAPSEVLSDTSTAEIAGETKETKGEAPVPLETLILKRFGQEFNEHLDTEFGAFAESYRLMIKFDHPAENDEKGTAFPYALQFCARDNQKGNKNRGEVDVFSENANGNTSGKIAVNTKVDITSPTADSDQFSLLIQVKKDSSRSWSTFQYDLQFSELSEDGEIEVKEQTSTVEDNNKTLPESIKEAWFGTETDARDRVVESPVKISEVNTTDGVPSFMKSDHWIKLSDEKTSLRLPGFKIKVGSDKQEFQIVEPRFEEWKTVFFSHVLYWLVCNLYGTGGNFRLEDGDEDNQFNRSLPLAKTYIPRRPVNLEPTSLHKKLKEKRLHFPWQVVEAASAALNSGKSVIFTGPPGCGKSKLAQVLAREATGRRPLMATASPAWTVGDLIGRYLPRRDARGLEFKKGFFLRAIQPEESGKSKWLIIDEFNRADIDACFGELFSVLAGDPVELPYEQEVDEAQEGEETDASTARRVRIIPAGADDVTAKTGADYTVPEKFRLIGTMNDADRSGLSALSFALQRRFAIIPVRSPSNEILEEQIIRSEVKKTKDSLGLANNYWNVGGSSGERNAATLNGVQDELVDLFARRPDSGKGDKNHSKQNSFENLVAEGVVGVSVVQDVIRFVGEGLRASGKQVARWDRLKAPGESTDDQGSRLYYEKTDTSLTAENLALSYLAMALVLQVFPQLEGLPSGSTTGQNKLLDAIEHIFSAVHREPNEEGTEKAKPLLMLRITREDEDYYLESTELLSQFLMRNLESRFPGIQTSDFRERVSRWLPKEDA